MAVERALSRDIVGLVRGVGGARWLQMLLVELPRLLGRGQTGFVKHLVEEVPWFDKSQVGRREFALFEEFCVALASLESDFLSPLIKHFFLRLRDTARAPPPALLSLRYAPPHHPAASTSAPPSPHSTQCSTRSRKSSKNTPPPPTPPPPRPRPRPRPRPSKTKKPSISCGPFSSTIPTPPNRRSWPPTSPASKWAAPRARSASSSSPSSGLLNKSHSSKPSTLSATQLTKASPSASAANTTSTEPDAHIFSAS